MYTSKWVDSSISWCGCCTTHSLTQYRVSQLPPCAQTICIQPNRANLNCLNVIPSNWFGTFPVTLNNHAKRRLQLSSDCTKWEREGVVKWSEPNQPTDDDIRCNWEVFGLQCYLQRILTLTVCVFYLDSGSRSSRPKKQQLPGGTLSTVLATYVPPIILGGELER